MKTVDAARGKWGQILPQFGIEPRFLDGKHHECPCTGEGKDRFRFSNNNGSGSFFCACSNDGRGGGVALIKCKTGRAVAEILHEVDAMVGNDSSDTRNEGPGPLGLLREAQRKARPAGDEVISYLKSRGLTCPTSIRQIDEWPYFDDGREVGRYTVMACKVVDARGNPETWHMTYLQDGRKANLQPCRKILPPKSGRGAVTGCAVRLWPQEPHIGIAEGIESAIAAAMIHDHAVWAVMSTSGMKGFVVPEGVERITIYADNDENFAGHASAYACAHNLARKGIKVEVRFPTRGDWNDEL